MFKFLFMNSMLSSIIIMTSANSWFMMWIGMEINLLSIIPLMANAKNEFASEAALKYFISQVLASLMFIMSMILLTNSMIYINSSYISYNMLLNSAILMKIGAAPFHFWFPEIIEGLNWNIVFFMLTTQKLAPIIILSYNFKMNLFMASATLISVLMGSIMSINQTNTRKMMTFSSINHIGWMLIAMMFEMLWMIYWMIYTISSIFIIMNMNNEKLFSFKQIFNTNQSTSMKMIFMMNFLSLSGLPPLIGFIPKWMVIQNLISENMHFLSIFIVLMNMTAVFFYLRISISIFILKTSKIKKINLINNSINFLSMNLMFIMTSIWMTEILNLN